MNKQEWLSFALSKMYSGQWFGWKKDFTGSERMSYENIIVLDSSITKPTQAEINAKIQELKDEQTDFVTKKASGKQKLLDLGLTESEIKSLIGV
jgi:hypothetical protein